MAVANRRPLTTANDGCQDPVMLNEWHVVGFITDFVPGELNSARLLERDLVVWRDGGGRVHVWEDLCVHRGARLSAGEIKNDHVICPYHGWRYNSDAVCTKIPAAPTEKPMKKAVAFPWQVEERYGFVWVCLGQPQADIPVFPEWSDDGYKKVHAGPYAFGSNGFRAIENFLDVTHFPFVHGGINGVEDDPDSVTAYTVERDDRGLVTSEIPVFQPYGDARGNPILANYTYRSMRPLVASLSKRMQDVDENRQPISDKDVDFNIYCTSQPVDETHCIMRICASVTVEGAASAEQIASRLDTVFTQDERIVATQRPERIPAELRYELHHRTDLMGQKYRGWLRELGITYGVI
ncbi:aromatic ring-hydroxylating dioxygenase subunit alpha [Nocardia sp. CA2R105]|uniref:aromatic ring-hydroxylating oxygenase subunit alpha n=1 Tax=Nocardia coffeae TaxID=2873381 RepID=UPI001CA645CA|nr:aromatic ring-hydroxylating dioxygenase subunit alpha [Nocardia coffeae]MBY8863361.1 aromatic ring-hydroxylating dioxygenase subunit alpha [Nocardia coffeae]